MRQRERDRLIELKWRDEDVPCSVSNCSSAIKRDVLIKGVKWKWEVDDEKGNECREVTLKMLLGCLLLCRALL